MATYAKALSMEQSFFEPGSVVASPADVAKAYRQRALEERMEVGSLISEPLVSLMGATSRLSFLMEGLRTLKKWGQALWARLTEWFSSVEQLVKGGFPLPIYLDLAKMVQRALKAVPASCRQRDEAFYTDCIQTPQ
jgi:hypothetical protein